MPNLPFTPFFLISNSESMQQTVKGENVVLFICKVSLLLFPKVFYFRCDVEFVAISHMHHYLMKRNQIFFQVVFYFGWKCIAEYVFLFTAPIFGLFSNKFFSKLELRLRDQPLTIKTLQKYNSKNKKLSVYTDESATCHQESIRWMIFTMIIALIRFNILPLLPNF